jgi:nickel/cobalt exporter
VISLRGVISPEAFNRFAPIASGLLVIGIGGWLLASQIRVRRAVRAQARPAAGGHDHAHPHDPDEAYEHEHDGAHAHDATDHAHQPEPEPEGMHSHGGIRHSHLPAAGSSISWRSLFILGLAGGIIPSTNALIILLSTIATGRAVYGLILVVAFGLGMAAVLGGVGLGLVFARGRMDGLPTSSSLGRVAAYAPIIAGVLVFSLGIYLTSQAVGVAPTL